MSTFNNLLVALLLLGLIGYAAAQSIGGMSGGINLRGGGGGGGAPPVGCTADGMTDWSNACDLPLGVAIGVL